MNIERTRLGEIDTLRGFAAMAMVLGHSFIVYPLDISKVPWCAAVGQVIYTFHMELFFVLAGMVYHCVHFGPYIVGKIKRILIPYLFFGMLTVLAKAFGGAAVHNRQSVGGGIISLFLYGGGYWFLYTLFVIFLVFPVIEKVLKKNSWEIVLAVACLAAYQIIRIPNYFGVISVIQYLPYFITGHFFMKTLRRKKELVERVFAFKIWKVCVLVGLFCILNAVDVFGGYRYRAPGHFLRAMSLIAALFIIAHAFEGHWNRNRFFMVFHRCLVDCGRFSLQLYLFNGYLLTGIRIVVCQVLNIRSPLVIVLAIWIGNLAITLVVCKWIIPKFLPLKTVCGIDHVDPV